MSIRYAALPNHSGGPPAQFLELHSRRGWLHRRWPYPPPRTIGRFVDVQPAFQRELLAPRRSVGCPRRRRTSRSPTGRWWSAVQFTDGLDLREVGEILGASKARRGTGVELCGRVQGDRGDAAEEGRSWSDSDGRTRRSPSRFTRDYPLSERSTDAPRPSPARRTMMWLAASTPNARPSPGPQGF